MTTDMHDAGFAELMVNMFGTLVAEFFGDPWNWFDSIVVAVSLVALVFSVLPFSYACICCKGLESALIKRL